MACLVLVFRRALQCFFGQLLFVVGVAGDLLAPLAAVAGHQAFSLQLLDVGFHVGVPVRALGLPGLLGHGGDTPLVLCPAAALITLSLLRGHGSTSSAQDDLRRASRAIPRFPSSRRTHLRRTTAPSGNIPPRLLRTGNE